jgi:hypothetical protein
MAASLVPVLDATAPRSVSALESFSPPPVTVVRFCPSTTVEFATG